MNPVPHSKSPYEALIEWFARNSVAANLLMVVLLAGGLFSAFTIKKEIQPQIETNFITVTMPFLGASPEDVEEGILIKIEEAIQDIQGIKEISSVARRGSGTVTVEVLTDYSVEEVMDEVNRRVDAIPTFPANTEKPVINRTRFEQQVVMLTVFGDVPERTLKEFAKQTRNEVVTLPGVSRAEILGSRDYEISIEVSEHTLQKYDLTLAEVAEAVGRGSLDLPAGAIRSDAGDIQVRTKGQAYVGRDFEDIVVRTNADGSRILLREVADIKDAFEDRGRFSEYHGKPAITIRVLSVGKQSELKISETVGAWVQDQKASLPDGISVSAWADVSYYLKGRLNLMVKNLVFGAILVFLTLTLFLRLKLAFWVMVGLPVAFLGTFFLMPTLDVTVNMISLFGFILVLGIVVDDAIIIGESAYTNMRAKGHSVDNIIEGVMNVAVPATFGVLTTMVAFLPILMVSGVSGAFFAAFGWVVILCLFFSIVESKFILPAHLAHMKVKRYTPETANVFVRFQRFFSEGLHNFADNVYQPFLARCLNWRGTTLAAFFFLLMFWIAMVTSGMMRTVFFPDFQADFLQVSVEMNEGTPAEQTYAALRRVQEGLWTIDAEVSAENGVEEGAVVSHLLAFARGDTSGQVIAELVKDEFSVIEGPEVLRRWREQVGEIPGVKQLGFEGATGPGGGAAISITLIGSNIDSVARASQELERRIRGYEGVYDIRNTYERGRPEIKLNIKPEAEALGLTLADLATQVRSGFYGAEVQRIQRGQDEVKVMVRFPENERDSVGYLNNMRIRTPDGGRVPFNAVAEVDLTESPLLIQRYDRERAVRITAEVDKEKYEPEKILGDILESELPQVLDQFPGVRSRLSGSSQQAKEVQVELLTGALGAMFLIYALMAIPLRSYTQPLIIMSVIPFGIIGALFGHWVLDLPVSMVSYFGIIALAGVVVNDSLILVDFINKERKAGVELRKAVLEGARVRFRPILLTSMTTFLGLAPITFEKSLQAQIVVPMAASLAFGIVFATVITLILIPSLYIILDDFAGWWRNALAHVMPKARKKDSPYQA
ncbi:MAG TPA: efflux RND transporter permease subunit [Xanthomonadales bacterium]|nr:efflux RND transporter permease subunit [Xanthomonadales bacterium]